MKQSDIFTIINDLSFRARIQYCLLKSATTVTKKKEDDTPKYKKEIKLTQRILQNSIDLSPVCMLVLADTRLSSLADPREVEDSVLEEVVESVIPSLLFLHD